MTRTYGLNWDLTKSLKLDFNANARAIIDEPIGKIDTEEERDSIRTSLKNLGNALKICIQMVLFVMRLGHERFFLSFTNKENATKQEIKCFI